MKLVTTEQFNNITCDFYRNVNDDIMLTREQIGTALEYLNPRKAIEKIHLRHKDRLDHFSLTTKLGGCGDTQRITTLYTKKVLWKFADGVINH